jgi:hypothetical protein
MQLGGQIMTFDNGGWGGKAGRRPISYKGYGEGRDNQSEIMETVGLLAELGWA